MKERDNEMAKVSIIVPIYNAEKYLEQCLESIRKQTLEDIEVICVDDGSTDASPQIMDKFKEMDNRFVVIHKPNGGNGHSMNTGLAAATGDYIGCVEADDFIETNMFEKLYMYSNDGTVDIVKSNFWNCYEKEDGKIEKVINQERSNMPDVVEPFTIKDYPQILWGHPSIWSAIYKRSLIEENGIKFKEAKGGGWVDNPFFFDTMCCAKSIIWTSRPFYNYRTEVEGSSSKGYDFNIPFDRMMDNLEVLKKRNCQDEETLKFAYARALMYLCGAIKESDYDGKEVLFSSKARELMEKINYTVIHDDFNVYDQKTYLKYLSPLNSLYNTRSKILIYNWVPFDNSNGAGGGVTVYCRNLIKTIIKNRPDVDVYFLSSGWAYDISKKECYVRKINNIFGDRCKTFEVVNSPVPAPQDMLFGNPEIAFENNMLKGVIRNFIKKYGEFETIHFNNMEGLSLDIFDLKKEFPHTKFVFSIHNYVPICMTGFYFNRFEHKNCTPNCTSGDCDKCIDRSKMRNYSSEMIGRGRVNFRGEMDKSGEYEWSDYFSFDKLNIKKSADEFIEFKNRATQTLNENMDVILAVSKRVYDIAVENNILKNKLVLSYIGTRVAEFQIRKSNCKCGKYFKIGYLGSNLGYEEKGYPFLLDTLESMDKEYAQKIDLVLTTTTQGKDEEIHKRLKEFHNVEIVHGYRHEDLNRILTGVNFGIIPVLWEDNLPQVAIEMVAFGVPILCSDAGGASELTTSNNFKFKAGDAHDLLEKLYALVDEKVSLEEFWNNHSGLCTNQEHYEQIEKIYGLDKLKDVVVTGKEISELLEENEFLYNHFVEENVAAYRYDTDRLREENYQLHQELEETRRQRDDLGWRLTETRNSKAYKIALSLSHILKRNKDNGK